MGGDNIFDIMNNDFIKDLDNNISLLLNTYLNVSNVLTEDNHLFVAYISDIEKELYKIENDPYEIETIPVSFNYFSDPTLLELKLYERHLQKKSRRYTQANILKIV
jgi:hypothetical protein